MKLKDWIGKTIQHAEIKGEDYLIHFTDGSVVSMRAYSRYVCDTEWADAVLQTDIQLKYKTNE